MNLGQDLGSDRAEAGLFMSVGFRRDQPFFNIAKAVVASSAGCAQYDQVLKRAAERVVDDPDNALSLNRLLTKWDAGREVAPLGQVQKQLLKYFSSAYRNHSGRNKELSDWIRHVPTTPMSLVTL